MDWRLKALAFRALELPGGAHAHYFLQRHVTRNWPRRTKTLDALAGIARRAIEDYARHVGGTPSSVLEVGSGRDLAVPIALRRLGVTKVVACDVERLGKLDLIQHAADHILTGQVKLLSWDDLERFGVKYLAPHYVGSDDEPVDCSCSNEVLEHVPTDQLTILLKGLRAVTKGLTTHSIDYSDHYARSDKSVSRLNFLRYSDKEWRPFNSGKQYVNRLRHSDYVRMFCEAGFTILEESSVVGEPPPDLKIADQFKRYDPPDLFAIKGASSPPSCAAFGRLFFGDIMVDFDALTWANLLRWQNAKIARKTLSDSVAKSLVAAKARYQTIEAKTGVPWSVIAVIHQRESSQNWGRSLAQGDPWNKVSVHVPAGRGPFNSWEDAAIDALLNCHPYLAKRKDWSLAGVLIALEMYNGLGYANKGIPSPYLWAGTNQYKSGKYVADGRYDSSHVDQQLGCVAMLLSMMVIDPTITFTGAKITPSAPQAPHEPPSVGTSSKGSIGAFIANVFNAIFKRKS